LARPRIFISSTYYDLKHIRASVDLFVDSLGFEPVLSEKGDIAYTHDRPLDESCYREVENSDVLVLLIGGRYGSEASGGGNKKPNASFFDRYESITKKEYEAAASKDIPIYILVEKGVYSEYQTFLQNKDNKSVNYAHVESVNVFLLIEDILSRPRNNPVQTFEKFDEAESWLREQWAGLFRELLRRQSQQQQLAGLTVQVSELKEVNETLKKYLEAVMTGTGKQAASRLIEEEERRLEEAKRIEKLKVNRFVRWMERSLEVPFDDFRSILLEVKTAEQLFSAVQKRSESTRTVERMRDTLSGFGSARAELNDARRLLGKSPFEFEKVLEIRHEPSGVKPNVVRDGSPDVVKSTPVKELAAANKSPTKTTAAKKTNAKTAAKKTAAKGSPSAKTVPKKLPRKSVNRA
jgi:uncharacterized protein DUF4062